MSEQKPHPPSAEYEQSFNRWREVFFNSGTKDWDKVEEEAWIAFQREHEKHRRLHDEKTDTPAG